MQFRNQCKKNLEEGNFECFQKAFAVKDFGVMCDRFFRIG